MSANIWKSGQSAKPSIFHRFVLTVYSWRILLISIGVLISLVTTFYLYLDRRYILDGPFDVAGPKELYESEKVTIRLVAPAKLEHLVSFVGHYSICPAVDRILVLWHGPAEIPKDDIFRYTTTHSKVVFEKIESASFWESYLRTDNINTPGIGYDTLFSLRVLRVAVISRFIYC